MNLLQFPKELCLSLFHTLAGILHLGNINFTDTDSSNSTSTSRSHFILPNSPPLSSRIFNSTSSSSMKSPYTTSTTKVTSSSYQSLSIATELLGISNDEYIFKSPMDILATSLTTKIIMMGTINSTNSNNNNNNNTTTTNNNNHNNDLSNTPNLNHTVTIQLNATQAAEARDSLAKNLYNMIFDWLVTKINQKLKSTCDDNNNNNKYNNVDDNNNYSNNNHNSNDHNNNNNNNNNE